jgi:hypothetical protein
MKRKTRSTRKLSIPKSILRLPDLKAAKPAVLNSVSCPDAQCGDRHAIYGLRRHELAGLTGHTLGSDTSTREYEEVLRKRAQTAGVSRIR